jgi:hypothetical protein
MTIKKSKQITPKHLNGKKIGTVNIPNMKEIHKKTLQELSQLKITKAVWYFNDKLGINLRFELSDGQNCTTGTNFSVR